MKRKMAPRLTDVFLVLVMALAARGGFAADTCKRVVLQGDVKAGEEWKSAMGQGWVVRVVPIPPLDAHYSGWDLVVDRAQPAGFPDALYLATPPYRSINEREIGTTYGLRAQDAIGWNPRSFRFLTNPSTFAEARSNYNLAFELHKDPAPRDAVAGASAGLMKMIGGASSGELRILDARIAPGVADPAPFAQRWAMAAGRTQHEIEAAPDGKASARGQLLWMRFSITLWLPENWVLPSDMHGANAICGQ